MYMIYAVSIILVAVLLYQRYLINANNKIRHKISHDELTGLCNWNHFLHKAELMLKNPGERYVICSNIADFKLINELFGRDKGNEILKRQAEIMIETASNNEVYGRRSDDKFVMIIDKADYDINKLKYCERQLQKLFDNSVYRMNLCFGIYEIKSDNKESIDAMCDKANIAIQSIKDNYQQLVAFYDESLLTQALREQTIVGEFDEAVDNGEFQMYLQPQVSALNGEVIGSEALVRWVKNDGTIVPPAEFIGIYEKTGIIYRLDRYMWEQAAIKLSEWKAEGITTNISVNISVKDLYYVDIYKEFTGLVEKYNIDPHRFNIEITESFIMSDVPGIIHKLEKLQKAGFLVEIDDFGSGYSSLNMLKDIKADVLKIDMGFLRETENKQRSSAILASIVNMAKRLNMSVITEGVETESQVKFLTELGCDMFQGYYYSKPVSVAEFEEKYFIKKAG